MIKIKVNIELYKYEELSKEAQIKAFDEHFEFLCQVEKDGGTEDEIRGDVVDSIKTNGYLFFNNGEMADCVTYTGKHKKAGITEFKFQDKIYKIEVLK